MCTKNQLNEILSQIVQIYKKTYGKSIYKIYLYGSYAREDYDEDSDIDIVAIVDGERKILQEELKKIWDISSDMELDYEIIISPTVIPYREFQEYKSVLPYYKNIEREGKELYA